MIGLSEDDITAFFNNNQKTWKATSLRATPSLFIY